MHKIKFTCEKEVLSRHFNYCKKLFVKELNKRKNQRTASKIKKIEQNIDNNVYLLFCENPFLDPFNGDFSLTPTVNSLISNLDFIFCSYGKKIFEKLYKNFRRSLNSQWNGTKFIKSFDLTTCPYCGMSYFIGTASKSEATLDHFLNKARNKNYFLSLNIYNLVPCCKNCNSTYKSISENQIINPHFLSLSEYINFVFTDNHVDHLITGKNNFESNIKLELKNKASGKIKTLVDNHINSTLELKERYSQFQGIINSIVKKAIWYNEASISHIETNFSNIPFEPNEVENMLKFQDMTNPNEPFSKFKADIWENCQKIIKAKI